VEKVEFRGRGMEMSQKYSTEYGLAPYKESVNNKKKKKSQFSAKKHA